MVKLDFTCDLSVNEFIPGWDRGPIKGNTVVG